MPFPVTPLTLGGLFDRTLTICRKTFSRNIIILLILTLPLILLCIVAVQYITMAASQAFDTVVTHENQFDFVNIFGVVTVVAAITLVFILLDVFAKLAVTIVASAEYVGAEMTWQEAMRVTFTERYLAALGAMVLQALLFVLLYVITYASLIASIFTRNGILIFVGVVIFLAGLVGMMYLSIRWLITTPAIAHEKTGVFGALSRSGELVHHHWWRTFGIYILFAFIIQFATSIITTPIMIVSIFGSFSELFNLQSGQFQEKLALSEIFAMYRKMSVGIGAMVFISMLISYLTMPVVLTVMYFDLLARKNGAAPVLDVPYPIVPPGERNTTNDSDNPAVH